MHIRPKKEKKKKKVSSLSRSLHSLASLAVSYSLIPHGFSSLKFQIFLTEQYAKPTFLFLSFLFLRCVQLKLDFSFFKHPINLTACKSYVLSQKKLSYVSIYLFIFNFLAPQNCQKSSQMSVILLSFFLSPQLVRVWKISLYFKFK